MLKFCSYIQILKVILPAYGKDKYIYNKIFKSSPEYRAPGRVAALEGLALIND